MGDETDEYEEERGRTRRFLTDGVGDAAGATVGTALTLVAGPWVGAPVGVLVGKAFSRVGAEFADRQLGDREARRAADTLAFAAEAIQDRLNAGEKPREDGFFDPGADGDEVLEGTLLTAVRCWERRKVAPLARLYASIAFDASVSAPHASYLLRLGDQLTYRQLTLLAFVAQANQRGQYENAVVGLEAYASEVRVPPDQQFYDELDGLSTLNLVGIRQNSGPPSAVYETWGSARWKPDRLIKADLMELGQELHDLMELDKLPRADLDAALFGLRGDRDP